MNLLTHNVILSFLSVGFSVLLLMATGCGFRSELPVHHFTVNQRVDNRGRVIYRKFEQVVYHENKPHVVAVTQEFDTLGRVVVEHGTDHPRLGKQYFFDIHYGKNFSVVNRFRWNEVLDTAALSVLPLTAFIEQRVLIDSPKTFKTIIITKISSDENWFTGRYTEALSIDAITNVNDPANIQKQYMFKLPLNKLYFDEYKRLLLTEIIKPDDQNF